MAKPAHFTAYDLRRKGRHNIPSPPLKLSESRLREGEWKVTKLKPAKKKSTKKSARQAVAKTPKRVSDLCRVKGVEFQCLQCGAFSDEKSCRTACLRRFRREKFTPASKLIDIRGPGPLGYGAFTKPNCTITKGAWIGEYLGDLRPLSAPHSTYRFEIPDLCAVDAKSSGNWTRYINSHCRPNVKPWGETVGKRHVILFQALRDIGPEEEIVFNYGGRYFEEAGFLCGCDAQKKAHLPNGASRKKK